MSANRSANRVFLVCQHHPEPASALCLGDRPEGSSVYALDGRLERRAEKFFERHAKCGVDCFRLAYERPQAWDLSPPADPAAVGVRMALATGAVNGSSHAEDE